MATSTTVKAVAAKAGQRQLAKRATLEMFMERPPAEQDFEFEISPGQTVSMHFKGIGARDYDRLIDQCPATKDQQADGASYDQDKFMPALLNKVCDDPEWSVAEWRQAVFENKAFGRGEVTELFYAAVGVCNRPLGMKAINPTESGSGSTASSS